MRCNKCGAELFPNDTFCGSCGAKVVAHSDNDTSSKPFIVTYEDEEIPYSDPFKVPGNNNSFLSSNKTDNETNQIPQSNKKQKSKSSVVVILVIVLLLLTTFTVFNFLLMTDRIDTFKYDMFEGYKESLAEFLHLPYEPERTQKTGGPEAPPETTTFAYGQVTLPQATEPVVSTLPETTKNDPKSNIPAELQQYASGLVYEGKTYRISLKENDWFINYRSSPQLIEKNVPGNNVLGKLQCNSQVFVEYIYNKTWAVFYKDGKYVFSSMYASNDPSLNRLMEVVQ